MQKNFEIEQGVPKIWEFKGLEMILLRETKRGKNTTAFTLPFLSSTIIQCDSVTHLSHMLESVTHLCHMLESVLLDGKCHLDCHWSGSQCFLSICYACDLLMVSKSWITLPGIISGRHTEFVPVRNVCAQH